MEETSSIKYRLLSKLYIILLIMTFSPLNLLAHEDDGFKNFPENMRNLEKYEIIKNDIINTFLNQDTVLVEDSSTEFASFRNDYVESRNNERDELLDDFQDTSYKYFDYISLLQDLLSEKKSLEKNQEVIEGKIILEEKKLVNIDNLIKNSKDTYNEKVANIPLFGVFASRMGIDPDSTAISQNVDLLLQTTSHTESLTPKNIEQLSYITDDEYLREWIIQSGAKVKLYD